MDNSNIGFLMNQGLQYLQNNSLLEAKRTFKRVLTMNPKQSDALNFLGIIEKQQGNYKEAIRLTKKAIKANPTEAMYYRNIGLHFVGLGKYKDAIYSLKKAIRINNKDSSFHSDLGAIYSILGRTGEAIVEYKIAVEHDSENYHAFSNMGNDYIREGDLEEAYNMFGSAISVKSDYVDAHNGLGIVLMRLGRTEEAVKSFNKAILTDPNYHKAYNNLGNIMKEQGHFEKSLEYYERAIQANSGYSEAYNNKGNLLADIGQFERSISSYEMAIKLNPDYAEAYSNYGNALKALGHFQKAFENYEKAIQVRPDFAAVYYQISSMIRYKPGNRLMEVMEGMLHKSGISDADCAHIFFSLAKAYDDLKDYGRSFEYLTKGNSVIKAHQDYRVESDEYLFSIIKRCFGSNKKDLEISSVAQYSVQPVFVVGMPRSGTTLVEQILSTHTAVHGAGELEILNRIVYPILQGLFEEDVKELSVDDAHKVHDNYIDGLVSLNIKEKIVVDKMPLNFRFIGFIMAAFPNAKIININRDPVATCWSIYKHYFSSTGNRYAYDLGDIARYYNLYVDLMSFWNNLYPDGVYNICYEELTENQEKETRKLLEFCELEWQEECLDFHKSNRAVQTASARQVRKKIYKGSSDVWRNYDKYLQPLISGLDSVQGCLS